MRKYSPFSVEKPEDSPGFMLWQTSVLWQRRLKRVLHPHNISHAQFVILAILLWFEKSNQEATQSILVNWSKLDKMTVSKSLKILSTQGHVNRLEHTQDTRVKKVSLTPNGKALASLLIPLVEGVDERFFNVLNQPDKSKLLHLLNQTTHRNEDIEQT